jgi:hypothetical protein
VHNNKPKYLFNCWRKEAIKKASKANSRHPETIGFIAPKIVYIPKNFAIAAVTHSAVTGDAFQVFKEKDAPVRLTADKQHASAATPADHEQGTHQDHNRR